MSRRCCALSYLWSRSAALARRRRRSRTGSRQRFGKRLYDAFFARTRRRSGGSRARRSAPLWAAQRIKNFSLVAGDAHDPRAAPRRRHDADRGVPVSAARPGPDVGGRSRDRVESAGIPVQLNSACTSIRHRDGVVHSVVIARRRTARSAGSPSTASSRASRSASSSRCLEPRRRPTRAQRRGGLRYRDLCLVALMTSEDEPFPDNWIYLHDPETRAGRVQNFGAWSEEHGRARARPASGWSTSASRATRSGRCRTTTRSSSQRTSSRASD